MKFLLQKEDVLRKEKNIISLGDYNYIDVSYQDLVDIRLSESKNDLVPIGNVEFVKRYCSLNDIVLPKNISYPIELFSFLKRKIRQGYFYQAAQNEFVKPVKTKLFTGAIRKEITELIDFDTFVWISEPVKFDAEFRCYVLEKQLVGYSRYDDGDDEIEFDIDIVETMIEQYKSQPVGYSIDVGIVAGETVLVELNDGWSLGFYPWGTMSKEMYIELITKRWKEILESQNKRFKEI